MSIAKLYVIPGSHPCAAVAAALALKGVDYRRVDLLPLSQRLLGPLLFGGGTVPGMRIGGERLCGSRAIMRRLDQLHPEPSLYPGEEVAAAEAWGDEVLQTQSRRLLDVLLLRRPAAMEQFVGDARLPLPLWMLRPSLPLTAKLMARVNGATEATGRSDLAALPGHLDKIDAWIEDGVLGRPQPNAADLQIGSSIRLLGAFDDLAPLMDGRPAARLADYYPPLGIHVAAGLID